MIQSVYIIDLCNHITQCIQQNVCFSWNGAPCILWEMLICMYKCMSHLGMLIRVTARAILSIVRGRSLVDPTPGALCCWSIAAFPANYPIFTGPVVYLAARRADWWSEGVMTSIYDSRILARSGLAVVRSPSLAVCRLPYCHWTD